MPLTNSSVLGGLTGVSLGAPTDAQILTYQASTGLWTAATPTLGSKELAYVENNTGTGQTLVGVANGSNVVDITSCAITVPANAGPVWIEGAAYVGQSVAGTGQVSVLILETTAGASTPNQGIDTKPLPNTASANGGRVQLRAKRRLGAVASTRTFKLQVQVQASSATVPSVQIFNGFAGFNEFESYLLAEVK